MIENDPFGTSQPRGEQAIHSGIATVESLPFAGGVLVQYAPDERGKVQRAMEFTDEGVHLDWSRYTSPDRRALIYTANGFRYLLEGDELSGIRESEREGAPMRAPAAPEQFVSTTIGKAQRIADDKTWKRVVKVVVPLEQVPNDRYIEGEQRGADPVKADQELLDRLYHESRHRERKRAYGHTWRGRVEDQLDDGRRKARHARRWAKIALRNRMWAIQETPARIERYYTERGRGKRRRVRTALGVLAVGAAAWLDRKNGL